MISFWHNVLFAPLLNLLIVLYNGPGFGSLAIAVIELTLLIRLALIPFTVVSEQNKNVYVKIEKEMERLQQEFRNDPVQKREELRKMLKKHRLNPWAKAALLGVQLVVLILLYQVFLGGINAKFSALYPSVAHPDYVNTMFFGFDLGERHNPWGAGIVAAMLFVEIFVEQKKRLVYITNSDVLFRYAFPAASFAALYFLPAVKSLFILTSMIFSLIVSGLFLLTTKKQES